MFVCINRFIVLKASQLSGMFSYVFTSLFKATCQRWKYQGDFPSKPPDPSKYNRRVEALCTELCDRLNQLATLLCKALETQVCKLSY